MNLQYYSGGIAEIVDTPTPLTYSFLQRWFSTSGSLGVAMDMLGLPYVPMHESILALQDGDLYVDLVKEQQALYSPTILCYKKRASDIQPPQQTIQIGKILWMSHIINTLRLLIAQSTWVAKPDSIYSMLQKKYEAIDVSKQHLPLKELDTYITDTVIPLVIAVGYVSEYLHQYALSQSGMTQQQLDAYTQAALTTDDWIIASIRDQYLVHSGKQSLDWYMKEYGNRADRDFELTSPRWSEIPDVIADRITQCTKPPQTKNTYDRTTPVSPLVQASINLQLFRTKAKRIALIFIAALRRELTKQVPDPGALSQTTREHVLTNTRPSTPFTPTTQKLTDSSQLSPTSGGNGIPVSVGTITGTILQITHPIQNIPEETIGVFPNASPEYSMLFPKCAGIIFLRGGRTSHGAIVAREFGIPAIIERNACSIPNGAIITIHGEDGTWELH